MSNVLANDCVANFLTLLEEGSSSNRDATGVFGEHFTWKKPIAYEDLKDKKVDALKQGIRQHSTNWLVGHNRLATQGTEKKNANNHPFTNDTCTVVHNGCLSNDDELKRSYNLTYEAETDSAIIPALIDHFINTVGLDEVDAVKNTAELLTGSYSVVVKMKDSGRLFYFKNGSTSFTFLRTIDGQGNSTVYGSTSAHSLNELGYIKSNGIFKSDLYKERIEAKPESGTLYELVFKEDISVQPVCEFKVKTYTTTNRWNYTGSEWDSWERGRTVGTYDNGYYVDDNDNEIEIEDAFEDCLREVAYLSDVDEKEVIRKLESVDVNYHEGRRQITLHNVPSYIGRYLDTYLSSVEWYDDKTPEGMTNHTIEYDNVYKMRDDGLIYSSNVISTDDDEDGDASCTPLAVMP